MKDLSKKVALVTGGAGGIGSAICQKLAAEGASVVVSFNSSEAKAADLLKNLDGKGHAIFQAPNDDAQKLADLAAFIEKKYGHLDLLVNNAGITTPVPHDDLDGLTDEWIDRIFQTNWRGSFATVRACRKLLESEFSGFENGQNRASLVVNISSVAAQTGIGSNVAYCASKAAMDSMTRSLARALAPKIRVVSVAPGWVLGEYAKKFAPSYIKMQEDLTPLGRLAAPEDVADAVFALATTMRFCTGNVVAVDGGRPLK